MAEEATLTIRLDAPATSPPPGPPPAAASPGGGPTPPRTAPGAAPSKIHPDLAAKFAQEERDIVRRNAEYAKRPGPDPADLASPVGKINPANKRRREDREALADAKRQIEREARAERAHEARLDIDPVYDVREEQKRQERQQREDARRQAKEEAEHRRSASGRAQAQMDAEIKAARIETERRKLDPVYAANQDFEEQERQRKAQEKTARAAAVEQRRRDLEEKANAPFDPAAEAEKTMERKQRAEQVRQARMRLDPAFAAEESQRVGRQQQQELEQAKKKQEAAWHKGMTEPFDKAADILHFMGANRLASLVKMASALAGKGMDFGQRPTVPTGQQPFAPEAPIRPQGPIPLPPRPATAANFVPPPGNAPPSLPMARPAPIPVATAAPAAGLGAGGGAMAALGPVGMAVGVVMAVQGALKSAVDAAATQVTAFGKAVGGFDSHAFARAGLNVTEKFGIAGYAVGKFGKAVIDVTDAVSGYVQKVAHFSGPLSAQQAQIDIQNMQRDMRRAQTMGADFHAFVAARNNVEQKLQDIMDKIAPVIIRLLTGILRAAELFLDGVGAVATTQGEAITTTLQSVINFLAPGMGSALRSLSEIERNGRLALPIVNDPMLQQFADEFGRLEALFFARVGHAAHMQQEQNAAPPPRQGPLFDGF